MRRRKRGGLRTDEKKRADKVGGTSKIGEEFGNLGDYKGKKKNGGVNEKGCINKGQFLKAEV